MILKNLKNEGKKSGYIFSSSIAKVVSRPHLPIDRINKDYQEWTYLCQPYKCMSWIIDDVYPKYQVNVFVYLFDLSK